MAKITACGSSSCVEVEFHKNVVIISDSKHPEVDSLIFTRKEWNEFVKGVKEGKFDDELELPSISDSKNPDQDELVFTRKEWDEFAKGVKEGRFNDE